MNCKVVAMFSALAGAFVLVTSALAIPTVYPHGVTIHEAGVAEGYMIFGGRDGNAHLIDVDGNEVHTWTIPCGASFVARPLEGGHILAESCGNLAELDWDGNVVWQVAPPTGASFHHNAERLPNGNTVALCQQPITDPTISDKPIVEDFVIEVAPDGSIVWEWHEADHFGDFAFSQERLDRIYALGGDWSHANGLAVIPDSTLLSDPRFIPGNVIITLRNQNTVAIIDRSTSQLVYIDTDFAIGPCASYMIPSDYPGGDNLLMLETSYTGEWNFNSRDHSRVWETYPVYNYRPFLYIDQYSGLRRGSFFTYAEGAAQRLPNGDTLITESAFGRVFEISAAQDLIWEYVSPYYDASNSNEILSAYKVPLDWAGAVLANSITISIDGSEATPADNRTAIRTTARRP